MASMHKWARQSLLLLLRSNATVAAWAGTDVNGTVRVYSRPAPARAILTATPASYTYAIVDWNFQPPRSKETDGDLEIVTIPAQIMLVAVGSTADADIEDGYTAFEAALKPHSVVTLDNVTYAEGETRDLQMGGLLGPMTPPDEENEQTRQGVFQIVIEAQAA